MSEMRGLLPRVAAGRGALESIAEDDGDRDSFQDSGHHDCGGAGAGAGGHNRVPGRSGKPSRWFVGTMCAVAGVVIGAASVAYFESRSSSSSPSSLSGGVGEDDETATMLLDLEGKSKKKKKKSDEEESVQHECDDGKYSKRTLKTAYELPFAALFRDSKGQKKYEASSVIVVDDFAYAICDSSWAVSKIGEQLVPFDVRNAQIGDPFRDEDDSGYEAIFYDGGVFHVVRESVKHDTDKYHAVVEELSLRDDDQYDIVDTCSCEFEFEGDSKGFEGAISIRDLNDTLVILGLCEGNHCSETNKSDRGNGKLVAMVKGTAEDGITCRWNTVRVIDIPPSAYFADYSDLTMDSSGRIAISSQEDSQLWVGRLTGMSGAGAGADGLWDLDAVEFDPDAGRTYDFPKNHNCEIQYCNIEGVHWIDDDVIIAVSDKMKGKGKQDFQCFEKDQSIHVFKLPK